MSAALVVGNSSAPPSADIDAEMAQLREALSKEIDTAKIGLIAVRLHFLATHQKQLQQQSQSQSTASTAPSSAASSATRSSQKEKEFVPATKLQLARSTPAVGRIRSSGGRRRSDRSAAPSNAAVGSANNATSTGSGRRHYHRRRNSDPSHQTHAGAGRSRSPPPLTSSQPAPTTTSTATTTTASASTKSIVPPLPSTVVVPSIERVLARRIDPALMPTAKRVCFMCETWLSGNAVEVPADADVFAHVTCLRCESCSLPVVDERKLKHLSAVACFKKPGENVFRCDVCANAGPRSQRSRRAFSPRSPRSSRRHRREIDNTNDDLIEFDDQLISPRSRRRHRHSTARAREPREGDVGMMTATFESSEEDMLTYFMGDFVTILACPSGAPMWRGRLDDGFEGLFRASHITVLGSRNSAQVRRARRQARGLGGISLSDILKTDPDDVKDDDDYIDDDVRSNEEDRRSRSGGFFDRLSLRGSAGKKPAAAAAAASKAGAASAAASAKAPIESEQQLSFLDMLQEEPPKDMLEKRATMNRSLREKVAANKNPDNEVVSLLDILGEEPPPKTPRKPIEIVSLSDILAEGPPPGMMVSPRKSIVVRKSADVKTAATTSAAAAAAAAATAEDDAESAEQSSSYSYSGSYTDSYVSEEPADEATTKRAGTAGGPPVEMSAEERKKAVRAAAQRAAAAASAPVAATTDARPRVTGKAAKLLGLEGGAGAARSNGAAGAATSSTTTAVAEVTTSAEKKKDDEVVSWADMLSEEPPPKSGK